MAASTSSFVGMGERPGVPPVSGLPRLSARIGKYEVEAEVGQSASVKVFRALDRDTARPVTLKVLTSVEDRSLVDRFRREITAAAGLRHRNFIAIYELGEHVGLPFAAMQHLDGTDLRHAIENHHSLTLLQKMLIMWQIAEGMQTAYQGGLTYVGVRPSAIVLAADGKVTIQDFGIVRLGGLEGDDSALYQAPEEVVSSDVPDELCDIFAWGTVYYELITGNHPFLIGGAGDLELDLAHHEPTRLRELAPDCPEALERMVHRALEKHRELRYQSLDDVRFDAEPILRDLKRSRASVLAREARRLMDAQSQDEAQAVLREALELDPDNQAAHRLRNAAQEQLQRRRVQPRVQSLLREADEEAEANRFARAAEILKAAVRLDNTHAEAKARLEHVLIRLAQIQKCAQLVTEGRRFLEQRNLTEAHERVSAALNLDPGHTEAVQLLEAVSEAARHEEAQSRIDAQLAKAKSLLLLQSFDEALSILGDLQAEFPDAEVVAHWIAHVTEQKKEVGLRSVTDEALWLASQDRPDLAAQLLREKLADFPDEVELVTRLNAIENTLPSWQQRRFVQDVLARATGLEQAQQWPVALTVLEEALETIPESIELQQAVERVRATLRNHEVQKKLVRRVDAIAQKMNAGAWQQAIPLIESALVEFPEATELQTLLAQSHAGLKRSECEAAAAEVRRCLNDGEVEQAESTLRTAIELLGEEPLLQELREELEADKKYREEWRTAQILFGRRQLKEAEQILARLAAQKRPEAQALLETVREARSASEEEDFYNRGREKALKLIQQQQLEQATDLLRNLLSLFPGDPILERDLQSVQNLRAPEIATIAPDAERIAPPPEPVQKEPARRPAIVVPIPVASRGADTHRRYALYGLAVLVVILIGFAISRFVGQSHPPTNSTVATPPSKKAPVKPDTPAPAAKAIVPQASRPSATADPAPSKSASVEKTVATEGKPSADRPAAETKPSPTTPKAFQPPPVQTARPQAPVLAPGPPVAASGGSLGLPASALPTPALPAPPAGNVVVVPDQGPLPRVSGGRVTAAKLVSRPQLPMPALAKTRGIYGTVKLEATVNTSGTVSNVKVVAGNPILATIAKQSVLQWRYEPATLNGQPTESPVEIQIEFQQGRN